MSNQICKIIENKKAAFSGFFVTLERLELFSKFSDNQRFIFFVILTVTN